MMKWIWNISKITVMFLACIIFFYMSLRMFHIEYEKHRQNEIHEQPALKVEALNIEKLTRIDVEQGFIA